MAGCEYNIDDDYDMHLGTSSSRPYRPTPVVATPSPGEAPDSDPAPEPMLPPPPESDAGEEDAAPTSPHPCEGSATACARLDIVTCSQQAGCGVEDYECAGVATPCSSFAKMYACGQQWGCSWVPK
jgi:hypothetical protein